MIAKPGGGERALGIPTILDRLAQTAAKLILEPIWEADLELSSILRLGPLRSSNLAPLLIDILRHLGRRSKLRPAQIQPVKLIT